MDIDILILGTGSLARALCYSLPLLHQDKLNVKILGRSKESALEIATVANARSAIAKSKLQFQSGVIDWDNEHNLKDHLSDGNPKITNSSIRKIKI